jgi:hypothetical protein
MDEDVLEGLDTGDTLLDGMDDEDGMDGLDIERLMDGLTEGDMDGDFETLDGLEMLADGIEDTPLPVIDGLGAGDGMDGFGDGAGDAAPLPGIAPGADGKPKAMDGTPEVSATGAAFACTPAISLNMAMSARYFSLPSSIGTTLEPINPMVMVLVAICCCGVYVVEAPVFWNENAVASCPSGVPALGSKYDGYMEVMSRVLPL